MKDIYRKYFQKSTTFLYPLLKVHKNKFYNYKPVSTYLTIQDKYTISDYKLICIYKIENDEKWLTYEKTYLINHSCLEFTQVIDTEHIMYVFDMSKFKNEYDKFISGKYSRFTKKSKDVLANYFGVHTPEWVFIESYLYPDLYFDKYAKILEVDIELLKETGELCDIYDEDKEMFIYKLKEEL
jgi:hypothetical protein